MYKEQNGFGTTGIVILSITGFFAAVIIIPLMMAMLGLINLPFLGFENKVNLNAGIINKTYDTDYCLSNYEWFKDTYNSIQQADVQAQNFQAQIDQFKQTYGSDASKWSYSTNVQYGMLTSQLTGVENYKADLTGQYDSRASQLHRVACKELPLFVKP